MGTILYGRKTDEINLVKEIERPESMYLHYRKLYHRVKFLCCSSETKRFKERKNILKVILRKQKGRKNIVML